MNVENAGPGAPPHTAATSLATGPKRVWLVDDNDGYRTMLADILTRCGGIQCQRDFRSADAAVSALASTAGPDVVLMDVHMRGQNGLDAIAPIKSLAPRTRVLMLTSLEDLLSRRRAMAEGAKAFLLKQQSLESLLQEIRKPAGEVRRRRRRNGKRAGERRSSEAGANANSGPKWWRRLAPRRWFAA